jgi:uncharacterized protein (TIGR00297 family)
VGKESIDPNHSGGDPEHPGGDGPDRPKPISAVWDHRQSALLVLGMGFILTVFIGLRIFSLVGIERPPTWFFWSLGGSAAFATVVWRLRAATPGAAVLGGFLSFSLLTRQYFDVSWSKTALPELALLFVLTFAATRFGRRRKLALGLTDRRERRGRQASQVMANLGVAGYLGMASDTALFAGALAVLAEATADTVSSELGQVFGGRTIFITTGKIVPPGTDGAISLAGTACGVLSAGLIAALAACLEAVPPRLAVVVFVSGTAGLLFDSLLGATLERWGWLGNDWVNFASTAFSGFLAMKIAAFFQSPIPFW